MPQQMLYSQIYLLVHSIFNNELINSSPFFDYVLKHCF